MILINPTHPAVNPDHVVAYVRLAGAVRAGSSEPVLWFHQTHIILELHIAYRLHAACYS